MPRPDPVRWKVLSPLLDELLDADPGERRARLESLRREDPLLAAELEAFLAHSAAADREQFLDGVAAPVEVSLEGKTVGNYTLIASIGSGGMEACGWHSATTAASSGRSRSSFSTSACRATSVRSGSGSKATSSRA
jgi:hypothetical protein